jgi:hypothetical protein
VFAADQVVTEAELAARGIHPVSVAPRKRTRTPISSSRYCRAWPGNAAPSPPREAEYTTYLSTGPGADAAAVAFMARALAAAPRWWRITATAYPVWRT